MSEKIHSHHEHHEHAEATDEHHEVAPRRAEQVHAEAPKNPHLKVEEARSRVHEQAHDSQAALEQLRAHEASPKQSSASHVNKELKQITLRRELKSIQRKLPAQQRVLSRIIHQPAVRVVSEAAAKSITRPSGLLGGGLMAFVGSTGYLLLARHEGASYNYGFFLSLFVGGFIFGLLLELIVHLMTAPRRSLDN